MNDVDQAIFTDLTTHALNAALNVLEIYPDKITRGDVLLNLSANAGYSGCAYIISILAPDLVSQEGQQGMERESGRLWRRVCRVLAESKTDEAMSAGLQRVTRNFVPLFKDGRPALFKPPAEPSANTSVRPA